MPSDSGSFVHCVLCGERVDSGFEPEHRGERPPAAGVSRCERIATLERELGEARELLSECERFLDARAGYLDDDRTEELLAKLRAGQSGGTGER